ncbi:MAG TPA: hypothetical protein VFA36_10810 [Burkholderiales bacterium]|jgi:hypothetical protein|nr:hypothetical protein [Burkholderiales bacterium]
MGTRTRVALLILLLAGCAGPGENIGTDSGWNGATYDEVVRAWGTPARSTKLTDGSNVYTWVSDGAGTRGRVSPSVGIGIGSGGGVGIGTGVTFGSGGGEAVRCERTLIFREGRVAEQNWQGPTEYCGTFKR